MKAARVKYRLYGARSYIKYRFLKNYNSWSVQMYYHEIKTTLRLHEFCIHYRVLKCQITKIGVTRIQYTFQWDLQN